jgi:hypothetical protein
MDRVIDGVMDRRGSMKHRLLVVTSILVFGHLVLAQRPIAQSPLKFTSSIPWLNDSFVWAKEQALAYTNQGSGSVGPWYEAALPGRNAFCMRDVSHQTEGAAALGLYAANKNMLTLFARSAAKSRDWAAYWEIDNEGKPSSADYLTDDDFWFNLPANFDVLDAAVRMSRWTGDETYRTGPDFQRFSRITMTDYLNSWQLEPGTILTRPRIANRRLDKGKFVDARGIPSYSEGTKDFIIGTDLLAAEYRAMISYAQISEDQRLANSVRQKAAEIQAILERVGWSEQKHHYLSAIRSDQSGYGSADVMVLYFNAAKNSQHIQEALNYISSQNYWKETNIEDESYIPLTLFRYGRYQAAYQVLANISDPQKQRREYPEVSYSVIAAIVGGVMGIAPGGQSDGYDVSTLPGLLNSSDHATITNLAIKQSQIEVTHTGATSTSLSNLSGHSLRWRAEFPGSLAQLVIAGKSRPTHHSATPDGATISWIDVQVSPGSKVTVSASPTGSSSR